MVLREKRLALGGRPAARDQARFAIRELFALGQLRDNRAFGGSRGAKRGSSRERLQNGGSLFFEAVFSGEPKIEEMSRLEEFVACG